MGTSEQVEKDDATRAVMSWRIVLAVPIVLFILGMLLPTVGGPRSASRQATCQSNLRNLILALLSYEQQHGHYPLAISKAENGPPRSWRIEILPHLEYQALRDGYDEDQPWSSPANLNIAGTHVPLFQCPSASASAGNSKYFTTNYVLITGPNTAFPDDKPISWSDITDGSSNTIIMLEINDSDIVWIEPRDLTIDEAIALFNRPESIRKKNPTSHKGGRMVAFADGHVDFAPENTPPEVLRALFTINDGIAVSLDSAR